MTTTTTGPRFDGGGSSSRGEHPPDLYNPDREARTFPLSEATGEEAAAFYGEHGYLAVEDLFAAGVIAGALAAIDDLVEGRNAAFNGVFYENAAQNGMSAEDAKARLDFVRKLAKFVDFDPRLQAMAGDRAMLDVVERLIGGPSRLLQDMALLKPPKIGREKPWHQDHAYFDLGLEERVVGVWIALDPADVDNGCMQVLDGGHRLGPIVHWKRRDWQICDAEMQGRRSVACPLPPGGALFFHSLLPHGTPTNRSPRRRRALQFHYAPADAVKIPYQDRLTVFGSEGKDVTC